MAKTFTPPFIQTGWAAPHAEISAAVTDINAGTGATTVVTAGANDSKVRKILFQQSGGTTIDSVMCVYENDGANVRLVGQVKIPGGFVIGPNTLGWSYLWENPNADGFLLAGDTFKAGPTVIGTMKFTAKAVGGEY